MAYKSSQTVFVVDDEPVIVKTVVAILNVSGFCATGFLSAEAAVQSVESVCPAFLITDVSMPGMNGIELAIRFKSLCPHCKVVLFSGHVTTEDLMNAARGQGHDFTLLPKPVPPKELLAALRSL